MQDWQKKNNYHPWQQVAGKILFHRDNSSGDRAKNGEKIAKFNREDTPRPLCVADIPLRLPSTL